MEQLTKVPGQIWRVRCANRQKWSINYRNFKCIYNQKRTVRWQVKNIYIYFTWTFLLVYIELVRRYKRTTLVQNIPTLFDRSFTTSEPEHDGECGHQWSWQWKRKSGRNPHASSIGEEHWPICMPPQTCVGVIDYAENCHLVPEMKKHVNQTCILSVHDIFKYL